MKFNKIFKYCQIIYFYFTTSLNSFPIQLRVQFITGDASLSFVFSYRLLVLSVSSHLMFLLFPLLFPLHSLHLVYSFRTVQVICVSRNPRQLFSMLLGLLAVFSSEPVLGRLRIYSEGGQFSSRYIRQEVSFLADIFGRRLVFQQIYSKEVSFLADIFGRRLVFQQIYSA